MAKKKKLNVTIAIAGLLILGILLVGFLVVSRSGRFVHWFYSDPQPYITKAEEFLQQKNYRAAEKAFGQAYQIASSRTNNDAMIQILKEMAELHKIHDVSGDVELPSYHPAAWDKALGCWNKIITIDPKNIEFRRKLLDYFYEVSDSHSGNGWKMVETNADELIKVYRDKNEQVDPLLLLYLGQSRLMQAELGEATDREGFCQNAIELLQEAQKGLPANPKVYSLMAQAEMLKGQLENLKGISNALENAKKRARESLEQGIEQTQGDPTANINLFIFRINNAKRENLMRRSMNNLYESLMVQYWYQGKSDLEDLKSEIELLKAEIKRNPETAGKNAAAVNQMEESLTKKDAFLKTMEEFSGTAKSAFRPDRTLDESYGVLEKAVKLIDASPNRSDTKESPILTKSKEDLITLKSDIQQFNSLKSDLDGLLTKYPSHPEILSMMAGYEQLEGHMEKAIELIQKTLELDKTKFDYAIQAAMVYYRQFGLISSFNESAPWLNKAIAIASEALTYPDTQDIPGPRQGIQVNRRLNLYNLLAAWQIEKYRLGKDPKTLADAEAAIERIQQFLKTSDNIYMGKWRGMLALAKGQVEQEAAANEPDSKVRANRILKADKQISDSIGTLYGAYQQLVGLKQNDPLLSYTLATAFRNRKELGARVEFLNQSFASSNNSITAMKPAAYLEFAEIMVENEDGSSALMLVDSFEASFSPTQRSRDIRFQAYLLTRKFDEAEEWLKSLDPGFEHLSAYQAQLIHRKIGSFNTELNRITDSVNSIDLQLELMNHTLKSSDSLDIDSIKKSIQDLNIKRMQFIEKQKNKQSQLSDLIQQRQDIVETLMQKDPKSVDPKILMDVCRYLDDHNQTEKARKLTADYIQVLPRYVPIRSFAKTLGSRDQKRSQEENNQITVSSIREAMPDQKVDQAIEIARYFLSVPAADAASRINNRNQALAELKSVEQEAGDDARVVELLFDLSLIPDSNKPDAKPDLTIARTYAQKAKQLDIDRCGGLYFAARIDMVDGQFASAMEKLTECIRILPIFPQAFYYRSLAQQALNNLNEAAKDADRAYDWTLIDGNIARLRATIYYQIYRKAGTNPTPEEYNRMNQALATAVRLNPDNMELLNFYADLLSIQEPDRALVIRQTIMARFRSEDSVDNDRLLASLALRLFDTYENNRNAQKIGSKEYLLLIAQKALEKARELAPNDPAVMNVWGEYLRLSGKQNLAEATLPADSLSLVDFYINDSKFAKARDILQKLYEKDQKSNPAVLRGLTVVALKTGDLDGLKKYTQELSEVKFEDPKLQEATDMWILQRLLEINFEPDKTALRIASFRERYPDNIEGLVMLAWSDFNRYAFADAQARVGEILTLRPDHAIAWRIRGVLNRMKSDFPQAISDLQKSLSLRDDSTTRVELAQTYMMNGQVTSAISELVTALEKPQAPMRVRYFLEKIYQDSGRNEDLQKFYDQTIAKYSDDSYWLHRAGAHLLTQYQKQLDQEKNQARKQGKYQPGTLFKPSDKTFSLLEKAAPLLEKSWTLVEPQWKLNPQEPAFAKILDYYLESLLQQLETQTQLTQFIRIASKYMDTPAAPIVYSQMAQAHLRMGDRTKALELFDKALESSRNQPEYVVQLLDVMQKVLESTKEVRSWCEKTLAADPKHIGANYTMFQLAQAADQFNVALEFLDRCLAQCQNRDDVWVEFTLQKSQVLLKAFFKSGDKKYLDGGVALYESILQAASSNHPKRALVLNNLAYLLADNNQDLEKAVSFARQALKETPNDPVRMDTLSYTLSKSRQFEEAEKMARMSIQYHELAGNSVPWDSYYHLGMALEGLQKKAEALASYQKALEAGGDTVPASDKEQIDAAVKRMSL